jgi:glycosyltransferase involved in cell wall biosynthesis
MAQPVVSIIMPVFNAGQFLEPAIASIFAQTFNDWELVAVDDGSTDGSWAYLQRINDPRVRIMRNERNRGVPTTLNRAIESSRGPWIARMDADDIILPRRLELQLAAMEAEPQVDALGCGSFIVDRELNAVLVQRPPRDHEKIVRWPSLSFPLTFGALMGKAEWWRRWRVDPRVGVTGHEFDLYFRSHLESRFSNVPEPLYVYRFFGHTRTWTKLTKSVYYRSMTLLRHGFRMGLPGMTLLGLASMLPRPLLWAISMATERQTGLTRREGTPVSESDRRCLEEGLVQAAAVPVPLR